MTDPAAPRMDIQPEPLIFGGRLLRMGDRIGAYVFEREIGSGGMARVLLARDPSGASVALKVLRSNRFDTGLGRFRREFHALSRLSHPNIIRVDAYGDLLGHPFIAMEFVDGPDLHTVIRSLRSADDPTRYARAQDILIQLCRALAAIHRRGLVHRDLKPSNVLLTREGQCKLTDFGIVKDLDPQADPHLSTTLVGTWAYTSPEHISGQPVDHRSDLYSLGVMLFALLTGKRPFVADSMAGYLEAHRDKPAPRAAKIRPGIPAHLDEICARLLEKIPRDRFQSAQEILYRLEADDPSAADIDRGQSWEPPLVGNVAVIEGVEEAVHALTGRRGGVVRITGEDGSGKSRLLDVAADRARMLGLPYHNASFRPDQPVFSAAMRLARELLREVPDPDNTELHRIISAWADGSALRGDTRYALYDAIRDTLATLLADRPRVLLLDDVHDAAPQELDLLRFLARTLIGTQGLPLLVVETVRVRSVEDQPALEGVNHRDLTLQPLERADLVKLIGGLTGPGRGAELLAERLWQETQGNAWLAVEYIRSLISQHLIVRAGSGWQLRLDPTELSSGRLEVPPEIRQILRRRVDPLPPGDRVVLEVLAVTNQETSFELVDDVLGRPEEEDLLQRLDRLIVAGLVHEHRSGADVGYTLLHRTLAEIVLRDMTDQRRQDVHHAVAEAMESRSLHDPEALEIIGEHYRQAGAAARAWQHLVTAAGRLVDRSLPEAAWSLATKAQAVEVAAQAEMAPAEWKELRMAWLQVRVAALANRAAWVDATADSRELVAMATEIGDERAACKARVDLARILRFAGDKEASAEASEDALKQARRLHYRQGVAAALNNLSALAWIDGQLDRCEELTHEGLLVAQGPALAAERARLLLTYALALGVRGHLASAIRHLAEAEALFHELRLQPQRVLALSNASEMLVWQGDYEDAWTKADEAARLSDDLAYRVGRVVSRRSRGVAAMHVGRPLQAQRDLHEAIELAREIGMHEEVLSASVSLVEIALQRRDLVAALGHGRIGLEASAHRDPENFLPLLQAQLAHALAVQRPQEACVLLAAATDAAHNLPTTRQAQVQLAAARAWIALGDRATAIETAESLLRNRAVRAFRGLQVEARSFLARHTTGEVSRRHERWSADLAREITDTVPAKAMLEARRAATLTRPP